ncbi:hypothetical protein JTB14_016565 [Gonioctena quinquepunctata]|nr:hypothetical protein JTB14_016565 [Gonioctena quinquepunctata]
MGSYEAEQARLLQMLNEVDSESHTEHFDESESDAYESDHEEQQLDSSDTEQDISDNEIYETTFTNSVSYIGKDGTTRWVKHKPEPKNVRIRQENIIKRLPGTTTAIRGLKEPIEIWEYFITDEMINIIVDGTDDYIQSVGMEQNDLEQGFSDTAEDEVTAGLLKAMRDADDALAPSSSVATDTAVTDNPTPSTAETVPDPPDMDTSSTRSESPIPNTS